MREAEDSAKLEKKKAQERVAQVERDFNEKERLMTDKLKQQMNNLIQQQMQEL